MTESKQRRHRDSVSRPPGSPRRSVSPELSPSRRVDAHQSHEKGLRRHRRSDSASSSPSSTTHSVERVHDDSHTTSGVKLDSRMGYSKCHGSDVSSVGNITTSTMSTSSITAATGRLSDMSSSCSLSTKRSAISFGNVSVHTHNVTLGDNPSVKNGPPLALEWKPFKSECVSVDEFEALSGGRRKKANRIPEHLREEWLRENGHSKESLMKISKEIEQIQATRCISKLELNPMQEYQVFSNVSLRQARRNSAQETSSSTRKKKTTRSTSLYSRFTRKKTSPSRKKSSSH